LTLVPRRVGPIWRRHGHQVCPARRPCSPAGWCYTSTIFSGG
jgi:hypothetical protein